MFLEIANQINNLSFENSNNNHAILENIAINYGASQKINSDFKIIDVKH